MPFRPILWPRRWWIAAALLLAAMPALGLRPAIAGAVESYIEARRAFEQESADYWRAIAEKRRGRNAKRRNNEPVGLEDYVLTQPPLYSGPPRPADLDAPGREPAAPERPVIPAVGDFLEAAVEQFGFVPQRPASESEFKRAYARAALAAGLTREQIVRIYAFETGGQGTYDLQAGLLNAKPGAAPISPALGYNQLLSTNSIGLMAEHGERFLAMLRRKAQTQSGDAGMAMDRKIEAVRRMIAFSRSVPYAWSEHDRLAKTTRGGFGVHAAVLDIDLGPVMQMQKLVNSLQFARSKGYRAPLSAAELELMNFTGDGNGIDMVTMPQDLRERVPTANFFQQSGYERNPIARRTGIVAALIASIEARMSKALQAPGAREMAAAFDEAAPGGSRP